MTMSAGPRIEILSRIKRLLTMKGPWRDWLPGPAADPYAWKPAPRRSPPNGRSGSVAVTEPDEDKDILQVSFHGGHNGE
jgi:hypothetical protein